MSFRSSVSVLALLLAAACSSGSDIASPGATTPTTPPGNGGDTGNGGGDNGGDNTAECPTGFAEGDSVAGLTTCLISGTILTDTTLSAVDGVAYRLNGRVDVGIDIGASGQAADGDSAVLTIEPGVIVYGDNGADHLVVNRGSQLIADGEASAPIIFTSSADLERGAGDFGGDSIGEWGGLVILGQAPISNCSVPGATPYTADCLNVIEGVQNPNAEYGGAEAGDNSGVLRYVQVRFAGNELPPAGSGNELNGISFGGVGSGTTLEYIQVHNNADDGIEMFGGSADIKYLVLTGNDDDSIDTDNGWNGSIQYAVVTQRENGGDNINEASSANAGQDASVRSNYVLSNFTFVGDRSNAFRLNTGTISTYVNGVVSYGAECFRWQDAGDDNATFDAAQDPSFQSVLFDCSELTAQDNSSANGLIVAPLAVAADPNNVVGASSLAAAFFPGPREAAVTAVDPSTIDPVLDTTDYIGAFSATETVTDNWASGWTFGLFPDPTCPTGTTDSGFDLNGQTICSVSGTITGNVRLTRGNIYELDDRVDVGVDGGDSGSLIIESGVTVFGDEGADHLVVNPGSQIFSNGTRQNPVIFTSENDLTSNQVDPVNANGEWGGLVILGNAPINNCNVPGATPYTADCLNAVEGVQNPNAIYGGDDPTDSSGSITYTLVKFAGNELPPAGSGNELNGISFGGVGSGTTLEYIQVHNNADDGIEMFGGSADIKYLVLTGNDDDSIDTDNGWNGSIQYAVVTQRENGGDNINEASSANAGQDASVRSNYVLSNFTFVGDRSNAFRLNTGTISTYVNGVVSYGAECFRWQDAGDDNATFDAAQDPSFQSVLFDCSELTAQDNSSANGLIVAPLAVAADPNNVVGTSSLSGLFPGANEAAVTAVDPSTIDPVLDATDYIGAFSATETPTANWAAGWSCGLPGISNDC